MVAAARARIEDGGVGGRVTTEVVAIENLGDLDEREGFDGVLSNFGAMNCVEDVATAATNLSRLVRPGGNIALCMLGRFCLWETLWYLAEADLGKAFRRWRSGAQATLGSGSSFAVYYPSVREIRNAFEPGFRLKSVKGVGVCVPPSYAEGFVASFPRVTKVFAAVDGYVGSWPGARAMGDHRLLIFEKLGECRQR